MTSGHHRRIAFALALGIVVLAGCTRHVSRGITPEGVADEVVFPDPDRIVLKEGTFPNLDNLRNVKSGVTKDQLYDLLGRPHFREGLYGVREWDYLFHFRMGDGIRTCQFKIIFDKDRHARSFHWLPADCASVLEDAPVAAPAAPVAAPVAAPTPAAPRSETFELAGDGLFAFNRSGIDDLSADARASLDRIADAVKGDDIEQVDVVAHTDRLGSDAYNLALSQARAESVRGYLISRGVRPAVIRAIGMGERLPVKPCSESAPRAEQIACLAPNRRVEIRANATHP